MSGWIYIIKNGDLYKIGITKNLKNRMRQLKPDKVVIKLYSSKFKELERELHKRYKNVRIPQTEYFRLDQSQISEIRQRISIYYYPSSITSWIFFKVSILLLLLFLILLFLNSLIVNYFQNAVFNSLLFMERLSIVLSFFSLFYKTNKYFSLFNELKFRLTRLCVFIFYAFIFRFAVIILF